jgi:hypothetical protein
MNFNRKSFDFFFDCHDREHEVPSEGLLELHYYTSERWVDRELREMLQGRCLVGEEKQHSDKSEEDGPLV